MREFASASLEATQIIFRERAHNQPCLISILTIDTIWRLLMSQAVHALGEYFMTPNDIDELAKVLDGFYDAGNNDAIIKQATPVLAMLAVYENFPAVADIYNTFAKAVVENGSPVKAKPYYEKALAIRQTLYGYDSLEAGAVHHNLGLMYHDLGDYQSAIQELEKDRDICESRETNQLNVATTLCNLATSYIKAGRFRDAIIAAERAVKMRKQIHGAVHQDVAAALSALATAHECYENDPAAIEAYKQAIAILKKTLGPESREYGSELTNLGGIFLRQKRIKEAKALFEQDIAITKIHSGENSLALAPPLESLAECFVHLRELRSAEKHYLQSIQLRETHQGELHPELETPLQDLAHLYFNLENFAEAESYYSRAQQVIEANYGTDHPELALVMAHLASVFQRQYRWADAAALYKRASVLARQMPENQVTIAFIERLRGDLLMDQERYNDAEAHFLIAENLLQAAPGLNFEEWSNLYERWSFNLIRQKRYSEAEARLIRAQTAHQSLFGSSNENEDILHNFAYLYAEQQRWAEAEKYYLHCLEISVELYGSDSAQTTLIEHNLALVYVAQGRFAEAERLYLKDLDACIRRSGPNHPDVATTLTNLSDLYQKQLRFEDAARMEAQLRRIPKGDVADIKVFFWTSRLPKNIDQNTFFTTSANSHLMCGAATVRIPKEEVANRADRLAAGLTRLSRAKGRQTIEAALSISDTELFDIPEHFINQLRGETAKSSKRFEGQAILYIHGYNNSFNDALRRAATIAFDLNFSGPILTFAWCSAERFEFYRKDRKRARVEVQNLLDALLTLGKIPNLRLNIFAHSTGAEIALNALDRLSQSNPEQLPLLGELVLAHADVKPSTLARILPSLRALNIGTTSYSSRDDRAMQISRLMRWFGSHRLGARPAYFDGVDAIDISGLGAPRDSNHNVFMRSSIVFSDIAQLIPGPKRLPHERSPQFKQVKTAKGVHWAYTPEEPA